ncbi:uncharacterized protein LAESUDRAFT_760288 [Laetiporus sulphureus 93-53]|uniref:Uncharacterized protein n=1 Tax=Laetiporus sulphureus 93-53 TaxID=1314785 RepID=A0A165DQP2_9APHY|nr:uncharacterized protein LAESUDRAFT_760288 [Laetiporus sulphureus 93-53]KZT05415.1 hypothetical protein LAESUDRAFT_760288 [Laetiporus sulphureus 93-53]
MADGEPPQGQLSEELSSNEEREVRGAILSHEEYIAPNLTSGGQTRSFSFVSEMTDFQNNGGMRHQPALYAGRFVNASQSHTRHDVVTEEYESDLAIMELQYGSFGVQNGAAIDDSSPEVVFQFNNHPGIQNVQRPMDGTTAQSLPHVPLVSRPPPDNVPSAAVGSTLGPSSSAPDFGMSGPAIEETDLAKLMQAMSLAVANGIKEGVQRALKAVDAQKSNNRPGGVVSKCRNVTGKSVRMELDEDEYFGDANERKTLTKRTKSQRGPRDNNTLNARFRQYLRSKGVLPIDGGLPVGASPSVVEAFIDGTGDGPDIAMLLVDWTSELSSQWNRELILLLSREFLNRIKSGLEFPLLFDPEAMTETILMRSCTAKLRRVHAQVRHAGSDEWKKRKVNDAAALRRNMRRQGIFMRRAQVVNTNKRSSPTLWSAVEDVLEKLEVAGMSSDHTDEEASSRHKVVHRARLLWRHEDIDALLSAIDSYQTMSGALQSRGNRALPRIQELSSKSPKSSRLCVRGLPKSYYDPQWLASLTKVERSRVGCTSDNEIPHLDPFDG